MNEALLVIDMQRQFHKGMAGQLMDKAAEKIDEAVGICRSKGIPVIWIRHSNRKMGLVEGRESFELIDSLKPGKDEIQITKTFGNAFKDTELHERLKERGIDRLFVCGFAAEGCVHKTYRGAKKLKYSVAKIEDAMASSSNLFLHLFGNLGLRITVSELDTLDVSA